MQAYCIVGARRGIGKTSLIEKLTRKLREKGIKIYTIKKSTKRIDLAEKDTSRHLKAGAELTLAISPEDASLILAEKNADKLIEKYIPKNGVTLIEGFRESIYPKIVIIEKIEDISLIDELKNKFIIICKNKELKNKFKGTPTYTIDEIDYIAEKIIKDALKKIYERLPKLNCGLCGYKNCEEYANAIILGEKTDECPMNKRVRIIVDGEELKLKPYVESVCSRIIEAFLSTLKGFNEKYKRVIIELKREQ